jgi:Ca2+-binding RTX toxin-like protein
LLVSGPTTPLITGITRSGSTLTVNFIAASTNIASNFNLQSSSLVQGPYSNDTSAVITGGGGAYSAAVSTNGATEFYRISEQ